MTPAQEALLDKAARSAAVAADLLRDGHPDFAVSRAYYAMFYAAEALLAGEGLAFSSHAAVIGAFGQHFAKTGRLPREMHRFLREAHAQRTLGDYTIGPGPQPIVAATQIERAAEFVRAARAYLGMAG